MGHTWSSFSTFNSEGYAFYDLENEALVQHLKQKFSERTQHLDNGCIVWNGELKKDKVKPEYLCKFDGKLARYDVRRVLFQLRNPDTELPNNHKRYLISTTCGEDRCIKEEHMQLEDRYEIWDAEKIWTNLLARGIDGNELDDNPDRCLLWTGAKDGHGYGRVKVNTKSYGVHVLSLALKEGLRDAPKQNEEGEPLVVRHKCTDRHCFRPSHLELGTHAENAMDKKRDGTDRHGEDHQSATISQDVAARIKLSRREPGAADFVSVKDRALQFGVSLSIVYSIDAGATWKELPGPCDEEVARQAEQRKMQVQKMQEDVRSKGLTQAVYDCLVFKICQNISIQYCSKSPGVVTPCSIWQGTTNPEGYGVITYKYCSFKTHILVCERLVGKKPEGSVVRHKCGQKRCCAEDHLVMGTRSENSIDAILHGDVTTKLTLENVRQIREKVSLDDKQSVVKASQSLNISVDHVRAIVKGKYWGWLS